MLLHESWHHWQLKHNFNTTHIGGCPNGQCDNYYFHGVGAFDFGQLERPAPGDLWLPGVRRIYSIGMTQRFRVAPVSTETPHARGEKARAKRAYRSENISPPADWIYDTCRDLIAVNAVSRAD